MSHCVMLGLVLETGSDLYNVVIVVLCAGTISA